MALIFDIEADGLELDEVTKIHCLSYRTTSDPEIRTLFDYDEMRELLDAHDTVIGHNIVAYDVPVIQRILKVSYTGRLFDTLALSWYLHHDRHLHGLESYGVDYGVPKPVITDWRNLAPEEYQHRCEEDVKINSKLWFELRSKLLSLYETKEEAERLLEYLSFKMDCLREQAASKWKLDVPRAQANLDKLEALEEERLTELQKLMPDTPITARRSRPAKPFKKDGTLSTTGAKWFNLLREEGLPEDYVGDVTVVLGYKQSNPGSHTQVKDWLFSLGWKPESFKYDGDRKIPQVRVDGDDGKELCQSVLKLADKEPGILVLSDLSTIQHRISIFRGFLNNHVNGWLKAEAHGLTNTLRFKHKNPLVNLPGVSKPWGEEIRGCLIAPEGYVLCGSDMVSLESNTKRHYMYPFDPEYVKEMNDPLFDEHLDLAIQAGACTKEDMWNYAKDSKAYVHLKPIRSKFKPANYACVYGVQKATLARNTGLPESEAQELIDVYWQRNWAVKAACEEIEVKTINGEMWLLNPVSRLWLSLRYEKDLFSTLNQSTGVFCFDTWIGNFRKVRKQLTAQFHDEIIATVPEHRQDDYRKLLRRAIDETNEQLKLNITLDIDIQFGKTYAEIH